MIAVDTSAMMAVVLAEPRGGACKSVLEVQDRLLISAATMAEARIVAMGRGVAAEMDRLFEHLGFEVLPVTQAVAQRVSDAYSRWGKSRHPARLNFGDCFAYEVARSHGCPLLFVGDDFSQTDVKAAL